MVGNKFSKQMDGGEKSRGNNTHIRKNRLQKKSHKERPRRSHHNSQGKNPSRRLNIVNIYAPHIGALKYIKKILEDFKTDIDRTQL